MKKEPKGRRTPVNGDTWEEGIHELERRRVRHKEEDQCRIERIFHFQTKGERHLVEMWIIFRDPKTVFNYLDKHVLEMVADDDILAFQAQMKTVIGGRAHEINQTVYFLQHFFSSKDDVEYFARKYKPWPTADASLDAESHSQK